MNKRQWVVYLILCSDESLYCGITNNLKNRLAAHNSGRGAKYTRSRRPVKLVGVSSEMTKSDTLKLEYRVKQVPSGKKIYELTKWEDEMTKNLKKNLQTVNKNLKALAKKVDQMIVAVGKFEKPKTDKAKPAKKSITKTPSKLTVADTILGIIKRSKKGGVDISTLMKKSSFNQKKTYNIVYQLKNQGKIKSAGKGVYVKV